MLMRLVSSVKLHNKKNEGLIENNSMGGISIVCGASSGAVDCRTNVQRDTMREEHGEGGANVGTRTTDEG